MADETIVNRIMSEYENMRAAAAEKRKKRVDEVNKKFPRLGEIDKEILDAVLTM